MLFSVAWSLPVSGAKRQSSLLLKVHDAVLLKYLKNMKYIPSNIPNKDKLLLLETNSNKPDKSNQKDFL